MLSFEQYSADISKRARSWSVAWQVLVAFLVGAVPWCARMGVSSGCWNARTDRRGSRRRVREDIAEQIGAANRIGSVLNLPGRNGVHGYVFARLPHDVVPESATDETITTLDRERPIWLTVENMMAKQSKDHAVNAQAARIKRNRKEAVHWARFINLTMAQHYAVTHPVGCIGLVRGKDAPSVVQIGGALHR